MILESSEQLGLLWATPGQTGEGHRSDRCHPEQSQLFPQSICAALNLRFGLDEHETT
jgi:hypothetical protein